MSTMKRVKLNILKSRSDLSGIPCTGDIPKPRSGHISVLSECGKFMYMFGGYANGRCFNDLHRLNLANMNWEALSCSGCKVPGLVSHSGTHPPIMFQE